MDVSQVSIAGRLQDPIQAVKTALEAPVCAIGHLEGWMTVDNLQRVEETLQIKTPVVQRY